MRLIACNWDDRYSIVVYVRVITDPLSWIGQSRVIGEGWAFIVHSILVRIVSIFHRHEVQMVF